jgi:5-methyltetrahydrofolate--homocysteine methyltransferase
LRTGWQDPCLTDEEWSVEDIRMGHNQEWYDFGIRMLHRAVEESRGKCFPSIGAIGGTGDTLAAMRDSNQLLYDVVDRPELVRESEDRIVDLWVELFSTYHDIVSPATDGGTTCWFALWAPGKFYPTHNDFSYMISPQMYREVFLPALRKQTEFLDYTVYHVDGVNAFVHVPLLCELEKLQALQILPGAGKPSPLHYMDTLRLVQDLGKNLHITIPPDEVEAAVQSLSAKGLHIATVARTEGEARELVRIVERQSKE